MRRGLGALDNLLRCGAGSGVDVRRGGKLYGAVLRESGASSNHRPEASIERLVVTVIVRFAVDDGEEP